MCTITDNKLIAEFMGYPKKQINKGIARLEENKYVWGQTYYYINGDWHREDYLLFHLDWNWLMKVVDKIESLGYISNQDSRICEGSLKPIYYFRIFIKHYRGQNVGYSKANTRIEAVYNAIIEFIKYYNNEN
jgi:hypothetical protein